MLKNLKREVCRVNQELGRRGLAPMTFGNVSGFLPERGIVVIKPSGVAYDKLTPADMVAVDLEGKKVEGKKNPSTDLPTHLALYRAWPKIGGVAHTHSPFATMFAQAGKPIPCLGTTHADFFRGEVPLTRQLTSAETRRDYEKNTGKVIVERFKNLDPLETPGALVIHHGPFTWGVDPAAALETSLALELSAQMALGALIINPKARPIPRHLQEKHYTRKHGPGAYYGQTHKSKGRKK